jgi:hypothetical protein
VAEFDLLKLHLPAAAKHDIEQASRTQRHFLGRVAAPLLTGCPGWKATPQAGARSAAKGGTLKAREQLLSHAVLTTAPNKYVIKGSEKSFLK